MRPRTVLCSVVALVTLGATAPTAAARDTGGGDARRQLAGSYIIVLKAGSPAQAVASPHAGRFGAEIGHVYTSALRGYSAVLTAAAVSQIATLPAVRWLERDSAVHATAQTLPTGVNRVEADLSPTANIDGIDQRVNVDVAVIDTGVDLSHPDLNVYRTGAKNCALLSLSANDGNGHGTHVAGTIGALDNATGVVGVAPGARIWPVKVLNDLGTGSNSDVICGIDYVTANASSIEVANMSLGGSGSDDGNCGKSNDDAMHAAICRSVSAGVTYVVAAGNDAKNASGFTPAAYDEVITVSALADFDGRSGGLGQPTCRTDVDDTFASFSNYGADVDIIAPGVCINSTWMNGGYNTISGTSMASPHVAGGAALYAATHAGASPAGVKSALQAAGTTDWNASDDRDAIKERLLNVSTF